MSTNPSATTSPVQEQSPGVSALGNLWHIYVLRDPRDRAVRYVGVTEMAPKDRAHRHVSQALRSSRARMQSPKDAWIVELLGLQLRPEIEVVERVQTSRPDAGVRERAWVQRLRGEGAALFNGGGRTKRGAWGGVINRLRGTLEREGIVVAEKHTLTILRRLEAKGTAKRLRDSSVFLRPDVHAAVERVLLGAEDFLDDRLVCCKGTPPLNHEPGCLPATLAHEAMALSPRAEAAPELPAGGVW